MAVGIDVKIEILMRPVQWLERPPYKGIVVYDPDGWDRKNYEASWNEPISEREFQRRLSVSTCLWPDTFDFAVLEATP